MFPPHQRMNVGPTLTAFSLLPVKAGESRFYPLRLRLSFPIPSAHVSFLPLCSYQGHEEIQLYHNSREISSLHRSSLLTTFDRVDTALPETMLRPVPFPTSSPCFPCPRDPPQSPRSSLSVHPGAALGHP